MRIGSLELKSNLFLSPLAGYTNLPFRLTLREIGGLDLATTDLVNARSLLEQNPKALKLIETCPADRPLAVQYADFLVAAAHGDFGVSIRDKRPAMRMVLEHFWPATVELAAAALLLSTVLAVPLGVISATHRGRAADHASRLASLFLQSMPSFWLGIMLILIFAVVLGGLLPAYGIGTWRHLVLPAVALAAAPLAQNVRLVRAGMLEVLGQDYVRTARAKGLGERRVVYRHALRNAALPVITVAGLSLGFMLSGALIIETVFAWPGMGRLIVQAVPGRDFPVIQAGVFVFALVFVVINVVVDILYTVADPRVRLT